MERDVYRSENFKTAPPTRPPTSRRGVTVRYLLARLDQRRAYIQLSLRLTGSRNAQSNSEETSLRPLCSSNANSKIVTKLVSFPPQPSQFPRWTVFRPLLNIHVEISAEEFETALLTPNDTLSDLHIPLLKRIRPDTWMALGRGTWVTVLCRKLRDWWYWVADGDISTVASHGAEVDAYNALEPAVRVVILKALCDIHVEVLSFLERIVITYPRFIYLAHTC